ncbi:MAG: pantetheine-phosphate adenylyltransferase [Salibacteraceae bacterium]|jgi:pantetheine-phosphate adenylyltransferase|nr:pantetheine-phosphate adenylyltransferase [Salibacteraceae bacterium]MDP4687995.1 pantetheine-phosphate adenylyltransferase [Salibacteraceae bacterium]MDP4762115.1 pantetheine-phosphate adenylyltransferase [Salibacteraceae bacterium]MDP4843694.1 pantetheine-phosphate adenylyltransferase [Salibacteraceae bacterium]MDP4934381.1 pantetheine-phosphate adenylyltransferase [Salibacteraceae bacterium]
MEKIAVFPGSFDPFTLGHESVVKKALPLFDKIIIGIGQNSTKQCMFSFEQREAWIKGTFADFEQVKVMAYSGLTIDFCKSIGSKFILRGLRNANDFQYESNIAMMNQALNQAIVTVFLACDAQFGAINSTIVREIHKNGGDVAQFLPSNIDLNQAK